MAVVKAEPETRQRDSEPGKLPPRRVAVLVSSAAVVLALDIISKALVVAYREGHPPLKLLGGAVYFTVTRNPGAAFSMATGMTWVFTVVAVGVAIAIGWIAPRLRSVGWAIGLGFVLAGALGNLIDRIFRAPGPGRGAVVDFISLFSPDGANFAIFNVADSGITIGAALIVLLALLGRDYDGKRVRGRKTDRAGGDRG